MAASGLLMDAIHREGRAALVTLANVRGSTPREAGAWMVVRPSGGFHGTIGGGALEWEILGRARDALDAGAPASRVFTRSLGPDLGQCCGGRVDGTIEVFDASSLPGLRVRRDAEAAHEIESAAQVLLFGAGHVGRALVMALAPLPFRTRWIDARPDSFPAHIPANATVVATTSAAAEIAAAPPGAMVLIMTHSHALDLDITAAALSENRFDYVGLIGSATKRARFEARLRSLAIPDADIAKLLCPIGIDGVRGKLPAVIAASVAAQLLALKYR